MHRIQKHFRPLTSRALFSPERQLTPPPTTPRTSFPLICVPGPVPTVVFDVDDATNDPAIPLPVPKPTGNFDLRIATKWSNDFFAEVQAHVNTLVEKHLDVTVPFSQQQQARVDVVHQMASSKFSQLAAFQAEWVTTELIKVELRRTSSNFSRKRTRAHKAQHCENPSNDVEILASPT